ncbi:MAG: c-type cytochrome [Candidatus Eisenbacteria bacterium]
MSRNIMKRLAWGLGGVLGIVLIGVAVTYAVGASKLGQHFEIDPRPLTPSNDPAAIEHGARIAQLQGCAECHGADLSGHLLAESPAFGTVAAPNLTRGAGSATSNYRTEDWVRAIRHGVKQSGEAMVIMPSEFYAELSDQDLGALISYLDQLPPIDNVLPSRELGPLPKLISAFSDDLLAARRIDHDRAAPDAVRPAETAEYGEYLANTCRGCHGPNLAGGLHVGPPGSPPSANITPAKASGIGTWTHDDFIVALRDGKRPDGSEIDEAMPRWGRFMNETEIEAIWKYLQSTPPVEQES